MNGEKGQEENEEEGKEEEEEYIEECFDSQVSQIYCESMKDSKECRPDMCNAR